MQVSSIQTEKWPVDTGNKLTHNRLWEDEWLNILVGRRYPVTVQTWPPDWLFLMEQTLVNAGGSSQDLANNPDARWDMNLCGFWIRPKSRTLVILALKGCEFTQVWRKDNLSPDWRDYD